MSITFKTTFMKTKITQAVIGGIIGTAAMSLVMFVAPMTGMPKMNPAEMLSGMMEAPSFIGWVLHFMIGIIFTLMYVFLLLPVLKKVSGKFLKGIIFGISAFIFAQISMAVIGAMIGEIPAPEGSMVLIAIGSVVGHLVFGVVAALFVADK